MGKGERESSSVSSRHAATPLQSLKDPKEFGPPPKHVRVHGEAALTQHRPNKEDCVETDSQTESHATQTKSKPNPPPRKMTASSASLVPPVPYKRSDGAGETGGPILTLKNQPAKAAPSRPRLPPRQDSHRDIGAAEASGSQTEANESINQGGVDKLGAAGISVPDFGIMARRNPSSSNGNNGPAKASGVGRVESSQLGELKGRFSRLDTAGSPSPETSWAQKTSALATVQSFRKDPSSVSVSDLRTTASTASNFRERHGDQVRTGLNAASEANSKYGLSDKAAITARSSGLPSLPGPRESVEGSVTDGAIVARPVAKKPPPPPPKRVNRAPSVSPEAALPPPLPLASKPKPGVRDMVA
jgi:hypothetical protein